jgi:type IV pilus assembly protein PilY1
MFEVTADEMPPNIIFLLDNGVEMKHTIWHDDFDRSVDYTPLIVGDEIDVVPNGATGNGFFNENGYSIFLTGGVYYLVPVGDNLELENKVRFEETGGKGSATWTINGKTITLPAVASSAVDGDGVKDNAGVFRYSKNYLNWLFFSGNYTGNGSDLSTKSRLYYAKKALLTVGKLSSNRAKFAIYDFTSMTQGASRVQPIGDVVDVLGAVPEDNILDTNYVNNINNMNAYLYSPLAEGLASIGGYANSISFGLVNSTNYCQKTYAIVVSAGISS